MGQGKASQYPANWSLNYCFEDNAKESAIYTNIYWVQLYKTIINARQILKNGEYRFTFVFMNLRFCYPARLPILIIWLNHSVLVRGFIHKNNKHKSFFKSPTQPEEAQTSKPIPLILLCPNVEQNSPYLRRNSSWKSLPDKRLQCYWLFLTYSAPLWLWY